MNPGRRSCYDVRLTYDIEPTRQANRFFVGYDWDHALYKVRGLEARTVSPRRLRGVTETFEVCPAHPSPAVQLFTFQIEARSPNDWFFGRFTANHVVGSPQWDEELQPDVESLRDQLRVGPQTPEVLRRYWRARAAYVAGGTLPFEKEVDADIEARVASFDLRPAERVLTAWRGLVKESGGQVEVGFEADTGEVDYVLLNTSFRLQGDYLLATQARLTSGRLADLLDLQAGDELRPTTVHSVPAGISAQFHRFRDGHPVKGDSVSALIGRKGEELYLASLEVSVGQMGDASCSGISERSADQWAIVPEPPFSDIAYELAFIREGTTYHCVHVWQGTYTDPDGDGDYPYIRVVDAQDGTIYQDRKLVMTDGSDTDVHRVKTGITVPYKKHFFYVNSSEYFNQQTTLPGGRLHAFVGIPEYDEDTNQVHSRAESIGSSDLPAAPQAPFIVPGVLQGDADHIHYRYVPFWVNDTAGPFHFKNEGFYANRFTDAYMDELTPHLSTDHELVFMPVWTEGRQHEEPETYCPPSLQPGVLPDEQYPRHCASRINRARAFVGQAYFYAQYARYIWSYDDYGQPVWSGGPDTNDGSGRSLDLDVVRRRTGETQSCGRWNGGRKVLLYIDRRTCSDKEDPCFRRLECSINRAVSTIPHELGHWFGNVSAFNHCRTSAGAAKVEGFADYISDSLNANWRNHRIKRRAGGHTYRTTWQFRSGNKTEHLYHGNTLYAQLLYDHLYGQPRDCVISADSEDAIKVNTINWSGMWLQYLNLVGNYFSDWTIRSALRRTADPVLFLPDWAAKLDWSCSGAFNLHCLTHAAHRVAGEMYHWEGAHFGVDSNQNNPSEVFVDKRDMEIQRAAKQHGWHRYRDRGSSRRKTHKVSQAPAHAYSLTLTDNRPSVVPVRFDKQFHTKWVSFFVHAGVQYKLNALSKAYPTIRLYDVVETENQGEVSSGLLLRAWNQDCYTSTTSQNGGEVPVDIVPHTGNSGLCDNPPNQSESMVSFTPYRSGWLYASVTSTERAVGTIKLESAHGNRQITGTNRHQGHTAFYRATEMRLGQIVPISIEHQRDPSKTVHLDRWGFFLDSNEEHYWQMQPKSFHLVPSASRPNDASWMRWSERRADWVDNANSHKEYDLVVDRLSAPFTVDLELYMADRTKPESPLVPVPLAYYPQQPQQGGWVTRQRWTLDAQEIERFARGTLGHHENDLRNIYVVLRRRDRLVTAFPLPAAYRVRVISRSNLEINTQSGLLAQTNAEGDSNIFNPLVLRRWCATTSYEDSSIRKLEKNSDTFAVSERLSHGDSDYFLIWMQEGEHLNITYRGDIPAVIDAGGAQRDIDEGMDAWAPYQWESELNYIWNTWLTDPDKTAQDVLGPQQPDDGARGGHVAYRPYDIGDGDPTLSTGWRPVTWGLDMASDYGYENAGQRLLAQRGYLWSFNREQGPSNSIPVTDDNTGHLTLTAYITGPYMIRVRGQGNEVPEPRANLHGRWTQRYRNILGLGDDRGYPYTLNVSFGVQPNRKRPHWQHLDSGQDPSRSLACGRY